MRLFVAVELPEAVRPHLDEARGALLGRAIEHEVRPVAAGAMHVTLKFLGEVGAEQARAVVGALAGVRFGAMALRAERFLFFPLRGPVRIVAVGVGGDVESLKRLQGGVERVCEAVGFAAERRAYTPHVTVGRNGQGRHARVAGMLRELVARGQKADCPPSPLFVADSFVLMRSELRPEGARHSMVERFVATEAGGEGG